MIETYLASEAKVTFQSILQIYDTVPATAALAKAFQDFFKQIVSNVAEKWRFLEPKSKLAIKFGGLTLGIEARVPHRNGTIAWTSVGAFAAQMDEWAARGFVGFVEGVFRFFSTEEGVATAAVLYIALRFLNTDQRRGALVG